MVSGKAIPMKVSGVDTKEHKPSKVGGVNEISLFWGGESLPIDKRGKNKKTYFIGVLRAPNVISPTRLALLLINTRFSAGCSGGCVHLAFGFVR